MCVECKRRGNVCVMVAHGTPCLGPVTHAGCGALCPAYDRGCYGCFGPVEDPNPESLGAWLLATACRSATSCACYRTFNAARPPSALRARRPRWLSATSCSEALARVEGEGALHVRLRDGSVEDVELRIYEPPRFFEAFLRGRAFTEVPDITARICGICPVAYQMSACAAMEDACGVDASPSAIRALRRLLYCGEWIESHALHIFLLHAPDFLGYESAFDDGARPPRPRRAGAAR